MKKEESRFHSSDAGFDPPDNDIIFEGMTSIRAIVASDTSNQNVNDRKITRILYDKEREKSKLKEINWLKRISGETGFTVEAVDSELIDSVTTGSSHGGIIAYCTGRNIHTLSLSDVSDSGFYVMLEGIEDPYNFGYALRTIYASGADGVILTPRNWMSASGVVCRASAGASELMPMYISEFASAAKIFKSKNYKIVCAGIRDSVSVYDADLKKPVFMIVGGEKRGISRAVLDTADTIVRLDYGREFNGSLSAASAASILAYEVFRQNR